MTPMMLGLVVGSFTSGQFLSRAGGHYRIQGMIGLGAMGGEPSGFSAKLWLGNRIAFDGGVGYAYLWHRQGAHVHADLLLHTGSLLPSLIGFLPLNNLDPAPVVA